MTAQERMLAAEKEIQRRLGQVVNGDINILGSQTAGAEGSPRSSLYDGRGDAEAGIALGPG